MLVVEHKPETIVIGDHVVDLGPGAGAAGGEVVFEGTVDGLRASDTLTGRHLDDRATRQAVGPHVVRRPGDQGSEHPQPARRRRRHPARGADRDHRCRRVGQELADHRLRVRSGRGDLGRPGRSIRGSRRSNPATYTGLLDPIRKAFAKANGVKPALFSANSEGACPNCNGAGVIYTDLGMMAGVATTCEVCDGKRFDAVVLEYTFGGKDISEVLAMSVAEAREFFADGEARTPAAHKILERLADVGLGLPHHRPAVDHAVRWRTPTTQAGHAHGRQGRRLRPRRADLRAPPRRRRAAARSAGPSRRLRDER